MQIMYCYLWAFALSWRFYWIKTQNLDMSLGDLKGTNSFPVFVPLEIVMMLCHSFLPALPTHVRMI